MMKVAFIEKAGDILGDTTSGLSGSKIASYFSSYAVNYDVDIPHATYPFDTPNKRTALKENLKRFTDEQKYEIIKELCELDEFSGNTDVKDLKIKLVTQYAYLSASRNVVNQILVDEAIQWLSDYPKSLKSYNSALIKFNNGVFKRNLLDDLRLSLELLLKEIFSNHKSLENQLSEVGHFLRNKNGSNEFVNMFQKLIDYFCKYQNTHVKHDDNVIEEEIEFIFEMTSSFMKHFIRMNNRA